MAASRMVQLRYYTEGNANNYPSNITWPEFCTQETFKKYSPITQLGIQALPGTRFYINSGINPIIIGGSGIFELDVTNTSASITSFRMDQKSMELIRDLETGYLIIDLVYGEQEDLNT